MGCGYCLAVPVVLLAATVFWLNEPLPPNTANPIKYKIIAGFIKLHSDLASFQSWLTGEDYRLIEQRHMRSAHLAARYTDPDVLAIEDSFDGVPVYIYQPKTTKNNRPGLIYYHGGGFRCVHPVAYESLYYKLVKELGVVIVSVDYRLAPQVKAPVFHEDCMKATKYFFQNAEKYGVNPKLIGAAGDSAGGNLVTSSSLQLRDAGVNQFIFQLAIYPWVQGLDMQTPSYQRNCPTAFAMMSYDVVASYFGSFLGLPPKTFPDLLANKHVKPETWHKYKKYLNIDEIPKGSIPQNYKPVRPKEINEALADLIDTHLKNPYLFPLLADDLSNLPPAYVLTVENDPIRDEGIWYANRLRKAGNKVMHDHSADGFHGMIGLQAPPLDFDAAARATDNMITFTREVLKDIKENGARSTSQTVKSDKSKGVKVDVKGVKDDVKGVKDDVKAAKVNVKDEMKVKTAKVADVKKPTSHAKPPNAKERKATQDVKPPVKQTGSKVDTKPAKKATKAQSDKQPNASSNHQRPKSTKPNK